MVVAAWLERGRKSDILHVTLVNFRIEVGLVERLGFLRQGVWMPHIPLTGVWEM